MDAASVIEPPAIEVLAKRLRSAYALSSANQYRRLSASEIRKLPYAYWFGSQPALPEIHPKLVQRYWSEALPAALQSGQRRTKRWLMPLFFTYCEAFDTEDKLFRDFARRLELILANAQGALANHLRLLHEEVDFFNPAQVPRNLSVALMDHQKALRTAFEAFLLWPQFVDTKMGAAVLNSALSLGETKLRDESIVKRIFEWEKLLGARASKNEAHRVKFANALLIPWEPKWPSEQVKKRLVEFFVKQYGDPRIAGSRQYQWHGVSPRAISVLMTLLAGDTLRGFMRVLQNTADEIWSFREKFWMAYYNAGYIQEAWLALGQHAERYAKKLLVDQSGLGYGRLESGAAPNQSVLLLKIGPLVFSEWSHNGSLRAFFDDNKQAPRLFESSYSGHDLRYVVSEDFHGGMNQNPELRHINSASGSWQRKARDFIKRHTNIEMKDKDIL